MRVWGELYHVSKGGGVLQENIINVRNKLVSQIWRTRHLIGLSSYLRSILSSYWDLEFYLFPNISFRHLSVYFFVGFIVFVSLFGMEDGWIR